MERSIELPLRLERFIALIERIRFTGASRNDVIDASTRFMSHEKRDGLVDALMLPVIKGTANRRTTLAIFEPQRYFARPSRPCPRPIG
jgi:hypothetical protein